MQLEFSTANHVGYIPVTADRVRRDKRCSFLLVIPTGEAEIRLEDTVEGQP